MGQHLSPRYGQVILVSGYPILTAVNWSHHWYPMDVCIISFSVLSNKLESMKLNIDRDLVKQLVSGHRPNKSRHLDELTHKPSIWQCDTGQWLSCFDSCQSIILWMANVKDVDLPRHAWDTPPFLLIVSPTLPVQSVDAHVRTYVRTYAWSVSWQPKEKRLTIFYEYGALSHARFAGEGAPLLIVLNLTKLERGKLKSSLRIALWVKSKMAATMEFGWVLDLPD